MQLQVIVLFSALPRVGGEAEGWWWRTFALLSRFIKSKTIAIATCPPPLYQLLLSSHKRQSETYVPSACWSAFIDKPQLYPVAL